MTTARSLMICDLPPMPVGQQCAACGCTDEDCSGCVERTGEPCYWIAVNLCSACSYVLKEPVLAVRGFR